MTTRLVLNFDKLADGAVLSLLSAPGQVVGAFEQLRELSLPKLTGTTPQDRGLELDRLLRGEDPIGAVLAMALSQAPGSTPQPIFIRAAGEIDALPWEQWFATPQGFLALDARWPIGRICRTGTPDSFREWTSPLRVVAVISALGRDGTAQLDAIAAAVADARDAGLAATLHVITGQPRVHDRAQTLPQVTCEWLARDAWSVAKQLTAANPAVLHLLCHGGITGPGTRGLYLATQQDVLDTENSDADVGIGSADGPAGAGSIALDAAALATALKPCKPWLVVLAACQSADAEGGPSYARLLVEAGLPAVIGMRRLAEVGRMDQLCAVLYPEVLGTVSAAVEPGQGVVRPIDWVTTLTGPRVAATAGADPAQHDTWSDPVLYSQQDPLNLIVQAPAPAGPEQGGAPASPAEPEPDVPVDVNHDGAQDIDLREPVPAGAGALPPPTVAPDRPPAAAPRRPRRLRRQAAPTSVPAPSLVPEPVPGLDLDGDGAPVPVDRDAVAEVGPAPGTPSSPADASPGAADSASDPAEAATGTQHGRGPVPTEVLEAAEAEDFTGPGLPAEQFAVMQGRLDVFLHYQRTLDPASTPAAVLDDVAGEITRLQAMLSAGR